MQKTRPGPADCRSGRAVSAKASPVAIADHSAAVYLVLLAFPCCRSRPDRTILLISRAAVDALGEPDREILLRRYYFGQKPREIAAALGLDKKQVDNRLYQTKRRLRASVTGAEGE